MITSNVKYQMSNTKSYPLYDVPWLVRDPNEHRMSAKRHELELRNQAVVDDYFVLRSKNVPEKEAQEIVAEKHQITSERVNIIIKWFFNQARKRRKFDFLEKFSHLEIH